MAGKEREKLTLRIEGPRIEAMLKTGKPLRY
jgi:hypothetical protein